MSEFLERALEERLRGLVPAGEGDWFDVRRRAALAARRRWRRSAFALAAALLVALLVALPASGIGRSLLRLLSVEASRKPLPSLAGGPLGLSYVSGRRFVEANGATLELAVLPRAPLLGGDAPLAVPSPGSDVVAYESWQTGGPRLHLFERSSGTDRALEPGTQSVAWRADGALAYWRARGRYRPPRPYLGEIVVRSSAAREPRVWLRQASAALVSGWAGTHLLVTLEGCAACRRAVSPGVLALDGPGRARRLPLEGVTAISPDGRYVVGGAGRAPGPDSAALVRVVEVASGHIVAGLDVAQAAATGAPARALAGGFGPGSWVGGRIVAVSAFESAGALVVLRFSGGTLTLERVIRLGAGAAVPAGYGPYFSRPLALDGTAERVAVAVSVPPRDGGTYFRSFLVCELSSARCVRGRGLAQGGSFGLVFDPSRPRPRR